MMEPSHLPAWMCRACETRVAPALCVLPICGHHFCERCLQLWVGNYVAQYQGCWDEFPCQMCWTLCKVPERGLCELRQDRAVRALQHQLSAMCMEASPCRPCLAGQPAHANHGQPQLLQNTSNMIVSNDKGDAVTSVIQCSQERVYAPTESEMDDGTSVSVNSTLQESQYSGNFEAHCAYELALPHSTHVQKRLCFPSCHTYEHHMF